MSNYIWAEKQIQAAARRLKHKKGWLRVSDVRSGNKVKAPEYRQLMAILVDRNYAFDDGKNADSPNYKICFNWEKKSEFLVNNDYHFLSKILSHPKMLNLPPKEVFGVLAPGVEKLLERPMDIQDTEIWGDVCITWLEIKAALHGLHKTGELKVGELSKGMSKARSEALLAYAYEIVCMYQALEAGWNDIKRITKHQASNHIELFVDLLQEQSYITFVSRCVHRESFTPSATHRHFRVVKNFYPLLDKLLNPCSNNIDGHYIKEAIDDFRRSTRLSKKWLTQTLLERETTRAQWLSFYRQIIKTISNPDAVQKALAWEKATTRSMEKTQKMIRQEAEKSN
jgi:hypothetical protein